MSWIISVIGVFFLKLALENLVKNIWKWNYDVTKACGEGEKGSAELLTMVKYAHERHHPSEMWSIKASHGKPKSA